MSVTTVRRRRKRLQDEEILQIIALLLLKAANANYADVLVKFKQDVKIEDLMSS
ncbi:hypothetical protein [Pyrococcus kukulkanii]|uniref:hypothetical protein n=1 Tax=Pyrococcus kukulkanii TaxID=1609559 RepID=UPI003569B2FA